MELQKATLEDIQALQAICHAAYAENFHHHWNEGGLAWYLEKEFGLERLSADLNNPKIAYFFIRQEGKTLGFVKFNTQSNLPGHSEEEGCELEKIYILPAEKGTGLGKKVMQELIERVKSMPGKNVFFLCVIDTNLPAIAFYEKLGFRFHSKTRLDIPFFKEELKGLNRMFREW